VTGARDDAQARRAARTVAEDQLVRCALHGADPNWGRILAALGRSGAQFDPGSVHVRAGGARIVEAGAGLPDAESDARRALSADAVEIAIDLGAGSGSAVVYGSDLSPAYVRLNAEMTS
jgi:glutamate N-acetyltransferase/amino-acid N-acetyltransferase